MERFAAAFTERRAPLERTKYPLAGAEFRSIYRYPILEGGGKDYIFWGIPVTEKVNKVKRKR